MACVSVLRFGPFLDDSDCATRLRSVLLSHFESAPDQHHLVIVNRYFKAHVLLAEIGGGTAGSSSSGTALADDGVVLVFDALQSNPTLATSMTASFDAMESVHDSAVAADTAGDLLRLCVGVGDSRVGLTEKQYEVEYSRRVLWCLDRGYEYIEADLSDVGIRTGHDARDKEGFARIVEAISGTVWSSAAMEQRQNAVEPRRPPEETVPHASAAEQANPYEPPDPTKLPPVLGSEEADREREEKALQAILSDSKEEEILMAYLDDEKKIDSETLKKRKSELEQERALDSLEGTLRQANQLRELSKSGSLSDEERRKRAGDAAMLLMNMMGKMELDDSSSDEEPEG